MFLLVASATTFGGSATWRLNPVNGDWNNPANWTPATVPNSHSDTATFDVTNVTNLSLSANTEVASIIFNPGAGAFVITASPTFALTVSGIGISNHSGTTQNFVAPDDGVDQGIISFTNGATGGDLTVFSVEPDAGGPIFGGEIIFSDTSTAGNASFANRGEVFFFGSSTAGNGTFTITDGETNFYDTSTADHGTFVNEGGNMSFYGAASAGNGTFYNNGGRVSGEHGGVIIFRDGSTAGYGLFITNGGAVTGAFGAETLIGDFSTAANARLITNGGLGGAGGGSTQFFGVSTGGTSRVEIYENGKLDNSEHDAPGVTIGSIEGTGAVFLGASNLTVGSNNLSTIFSGGIQDGGISGGRRGSLTKIGTGKLVLTNGNTYTGGTEVEGGALVVNNRAGSGTGSGAVQIHAGALGGRGIIAGAVTVGTGSGAGAGLSPGKSALKPRTLNIAGAITFNSDATYKVGLNSLHVIADEVVVNGVTIESGALFSLRGAGHGTLTPGKAFTVIDNTSGTPIAGTFANLADGSTFTLNGNTYEASYEGGDGNDLTLTVR